MKNKEIDELFVPATMEERQKNIIVQKPSTYRQDILIRFTKNKIAVISAIFIILLLVLSILIPIISPYKFDEQVKGSEYIPAFKSLNHIFGTDSLGRDYFVRLMFGARISLAIGFITSVMVVIIGCIYGAVSGYFGGIIDSIMMRMVDILYSIPVMLIIILLSVVLKPALEGVFEKYKLTNILDAGLVSIFITLSLFYWTDMARMVRGQVLSLKHAEYVNASIALGAKPWHIITKHLLPNSVDIILVTAMLNIPVAIFTEAFLSFVGLGVSAPMASLGSLASDALGSVYSYPHMLIFPSVLISFIILAFNIIGDSLRDALDPHIKNKG